MALTEIDTNDSSNIFLGLGLLGQRDVDKERADEADEEEDREGAKILRIHGRQAGWLTSWVLVWSGCQVDDCCVSRFLIVTVAFFFLMRALHNKKQRRGSGHQFRLSTRRG